MQFLFGFVCGSILFLGAVVGAALLFPTLFCGFCCANRGKSVADFHIVVYLLNGSFLPFVWIFNSHVNIFIGATFGVFAACMFTIFANAFTPVFVCEDCTKKHYD
jgi:hypothetical protein